MFIQKGIVFLLDFVAFAIMGLWLYFTQPSGASLATTLICFFIPTLIVKYITTIILFLSTKKIEVFMVAGLIFLLFFSALTYPFSSPIFNLEKTQVYFWLTLFFSILVFSGYAYMLKILKTEIFF